MAEALSPGVVRRVAALFPAGQRAEVADLLASECGSNLPSADTLGPAGVDRVRFAVLKISDGSLDRLRAAVAQAQFDWRDTLVGAAFGDDPQAHLAWSADAIDAPATGQPAERAGVGRRLVAVALGVVGASAGGVAPWLLPDHCRPWWLGWACFVLFVPAGSVTAFLGARGRAADLHDFSAGRFANEFAGELIGCLAVALVVGLLSLIW